MTFNTGNPIGSTDARDLSDNAENFDKALGTISPTWVDRLGVTRDTFEGALSKLSFYRVGTFAAGYTLTNMRQTLEYNGHEYSWAGTFPKVVAAGSTPTTSGGIGAGAWVDRTDVTLRSEINIVVKRFNSVAEMSADTALQVGQVVETIGYYSGELTELRKPISGNRYVIVSAGTGTEDGGSFINLSNGLQAKGLFSDGVNVHQFGAKGDGANDDTAAFQNALNFVSGVTISNSNNTPTNKGGVVLIPAGSYVVGNLFWRPWCALVGESHQNTLLIPKSTATGYMFSTTNTTDLPRGICIENFTVAPSFDFPTDAANKPVINVFNFNSFQHSCLVRDVKVFNIDGTILNLAGAQDIEFENIEVIYCSKPINLEWHLVGGSTTANYTNAIKWIACRFERSGQSTITSARSQHFIACKFEEAQIQIDNPHGIDFIGCDWAVSAIYAVIVAGDGTNRGLRIIGGSVDTGLPINTGSNTAKFIQANVNVLMSGVSLRGLGSSGVLGDVTLSDCIFSECDRPYANITSKYAGMPRVHTWSDANGTGGNAVAIYGSSASVAVDDVFPATFTPNTWYLNGSGKNVILYLRLPYNTASSSSTHEIKTKNINSDERSIGTIVHALGTGSGADIIPVVLIPGQSVYTNFAGGGDFVTSTCLFIG